MKSIVFTCTALFFTIVAFAQKADSSNYYYQQGLIEKNNRRFAQAFAHFQKSLQYNTENADVQQEFGLTALELRNYIAAKPAFQKVMALRKNDPVALENLATIAFWTRKWSEAILYANQMVQSKVGKNANYILGKSHYELENYGDAYKYLLAAAKEDPKNGELPYLIARSFVDMSNYKSAAPFFAQAVALDTAKSRWAYEAALNFSTMNDEKSAIKYYQLAIQRGYKTDNDFYENLANSYIGAGQGDKGIEILKNILEKKPADVQLLYNLADIHFRLGKYDEAINYWDRLLGLDKQNARSLYMIGLSYQKKGNKQKGMQLCDKAIEMDPSLANMKQKKEMMGF